MELSKIVNCLFWATYQCIFSTVRAPAYGARAIVYCMVYIIFSRPAGQPHKLMIFTITPTCNRSMNLISVFPSKRTSYCRLCIRMQLASSVRTYTYTCMRAPLRVVSCPASLSNKAKGERESGNFRNFSCIAREMRNV